MLKLASEKKELWWEGINLYYKSLVKRTSEGVCGKTVRPTVQEGGGKGDVMPSGPFVLS